MRLTTPPAIRTLQRKLYVKAKAEPAYRFYSLYDKVYRTDILAHAYALAKANGGVPGVDGQTFKDIESAGLESWLMRLQKDLRTRRYRPAAVRRVYIERHRKAWGQRRAAVRNSDNPRSRGPNGRDARVVADFRNGVCRRDVRISAATQRAASGGGGARRAAGGLHRCRRLRPLP